MSRGFPSMTALLGMLAIAGYQNRDKIAELVGNLTKGNPGQPGAPGQQGDQGGLGGLLGQLGGAGAGAGAGGFLGSGINELLERFGQNGHRETADSWVQPGANREIAAPQLEQAIGPDVLETLTRQTGLTREELLARLSRELPNAVDRYTPDGRVPA